MMTNLKKNLNELSTFMQSEVYTLLDAGTKTTLVKMKTELCRQYFMEIARNLHRNKYKGCYAPHKAVMIISIMELVEEGHITTNVVYLDQELKDKFNEVWDRTVPVGSPFVCGYANPFLYMESEGFWKLSEDGSRADISWESFCAFSNSQSREVIREYLKGTIANDTVSTEYRNNNPYIDWKVAEDILSVIPLLGILTAV